MSSADVNEIIRECQECGRIAHLVNVGQWCCPRCVGGETDE